MWSCDALTLPSRVIVLLCFIPNNCVPYYPVDTESEYCSFVILLLPVVGVLFKEATLNLEAVLTGVLR